MSDEQALAEALMDAGPDLMGWSTGGNLHSGDARTILAALAARGWRLYQFDNPVEVAGGVAMTPEGERAAIAADRTWASGYAAGRAAAREPAGAGLDVERLARAICSEREPTVPATADVFVDDECRALAMRVADRYAALLDPKP